MAYNLEKRIKELKFERKQVLQHLSEIDQKISVLQQTIDIMETKRNINQYNTTNFIYRRKYRLFKGKVRKYILSMMKNNPQQHFTIAELTIRIFAIENNEDTPSQKHFDSIRKQLNKFHKDGIITRTQIDVKTVYWQWKN